MLPTPNLQNERAFLYTPNITHELQLRQCPKCIELFFKGGEDPLADAQLIHANGFEIVSERLVKFVCDLASSISKEADESEIA